MIIGVDIDEVLAEFLKSFLKYHNQEYNTSFSTRDFNSYKLEDTIGVSLEETLKRLDKFHKTPYFRGIEPVKGSIEGIATLYSQGNHQLHILTARPNHIEDETNTWIEKYFPNKFKSVNILNYFGSTGEKITKREMCDSLGVDIMIEDNYDYACDCAKPDRLVTLIEKPWNSGRPIPEGVVRVGNWNEITRTILENSQDKQQSYQTQNF